MKQSRAASLIESVANVAVGFGLSCALQATILPAMGVPMPWSVNIAFAVIMTVVSIARSFGMRRLFEALNLRKPLSPFMRAVIAERQRQVDVEGWTTEHDDKHDAGDLAQAGACYALMAQHHLDPNIVAVPAPYMWPWSPEWWKPTDFRRNLVKAGALVIAEGERFDRAKKPARAAARVQPLALGRVPLDRDPEARGAVPLQRKAR